MPEGIRKYSWIIVALVLIAGGTIYTMIAGGPGFTVGSDAEKLLIAVEKQADVIMYSDIDEISLINKPQLGDAVDAETGNGTSYGKYKNEQYGEYTLYLYNRPSTCIEIRHNGTVTLVNDSNDRRTRSLYNTLVKQIGE